MRRWWLIAFGLVACGSAQPAPVQAGAGKLEPRATDCATKETFVEAGDSALEVTIVNCITGEQIPAPWITAIGVDTEVKFEAFIDESGRYRLQLPEGRYYLSVLLDDGDKYDLEPIAIRAQHTTVKEIRLDEVGASLCSPARGRPAVAAPADRDALIAAVVDHYVAGGIIDAPPRSDPGPTYITIKTIKDPSTVALRSDYPRQYIVTTEDDLQREATRSGRDIHFINISGFEIARSCATVTVGGDVVFAIRDIAKMCCCNETELFLRRGDRWVLRMSRGGICF